MKFDDLCKLFESKLLESTDKLSKIVDGFKFALLTLKKDGTKAVDDLYIKVDQLNSDFSDFELPKTTKELDAKTEDHSAAYDHAKIACIEVMDILENDKVDVKQLTSALETAMEALQDFVKVNIL